MTGAAAVIDLSVWQLAGVALLVGVIIAVSIHQALGLERDLAGGSLRTMAQLYGVGLMLTAVFAAARWYWVMLMGVMGVSTQAAVSHLNKPIPGGHRIAATASRASSAPDRALSRVAPAVVVWSGPSAITSLLHVSSQKGRAWPRVPPKPSLSISSWGFLATPPKRYIPGVTLSNSARSTGQFPGHPGSDRHWLWRDDTRA